ncbi:unnamed protein product [Peronospora destructor]|uniref:ethanolamine-phosphate cytidylyltransferase n=1 Tax=Peronospora destructor TaxID=86335 RepID=A0AAV0UNJ6_9STRA|nr:unnamed protein product [Peronospora destructor]
MSETFVSRTVLYVHKLLHSPTADDIMVYAHNLFARLGLPEPYPDAERLAIALLTGIFTLLVYFVLFGKRHRQKRRVLQLDLDKAYKKVQELQERMAQMEVEERKAPPKEQIRIWMDGAFDMMHYGHMNAFRQARSLGTYLVVGVNDDESITACKGAPPVLNNEERIASVKGCKFVDEVEPHCPYIMNEDYLQRMIRKHRIDYVVHGDDPCIVDGKDVYESAQKLGKYRTIPRTEGVSTSDILGRMLVMHKTHHTHDHFAGNGQLSSRMLQDKKVKERQSKFLTTNRMLRLFSVGNHEPLKTEKIVYIDGAFDMFHAGHVEILRLAKEQGSYLIVGVHNDSVVNAHRGLNYPIMNLHERVLSVLGCKYVDDVLIDAPLYVTREMVASLSISVVVHGTHRDRNRLPKHSVEEHYEYARKAGILKLIESPIKLDVHDIVTRINGNRESFEKKFVSKMKSEEEYYADRALLLPRSTRVLSRQQLAALFQRQNSLIYRDYKRVARLQSVPRSNLYLALLVLSAPALSSVSCTSKLSMESANAVKAEELYNDNTFDRRELLAMLKEMHASEPEDIGVIWRLTRAAYDVANLKATSEDEEKELTYYARDIIQKGLDLTEDVAAVHNWYGIILSSIGDYEGSKVSIANSSVIKSHWEKAVELNPHNPTTYYLLGRWCIAIADLSWLERKAAAVLFGTPPESSYDEALNFLHKSEELAPDSWKKRSLLIAQVYQKKKDYMKAKEWVQKAWAIPISSEEDEIAHEEAQTLLTKL